MTKIPAISNPVISFLYIFLLCAITGKSFAQCPPNIGFETGNFDHWTVVSPEYLDPSRFEIISDTPGGQLGIYNMFPALCPYGNSKHSVHIMSYGRNTSGYYPGISSISNTFIVPSNDYILTYYYALAATFSGGEPYDQAKMEIITYDSTWNSLVDCGTVRHILGYENSQDFIQVNPASALPWYMPWHTMPVDLSGRLGHKITITLKATGVLSFKSVRPPPPVNMYFDVNEPCEQTLISTPYCIGDTSITLTAPPGFPSYTWFNSTMGSIAGATGQTLTIHPPPPPGTVYYVQMNALTPPAGFVCSGKIKTVVEMIPEVIADAGPDINYCGKDKPRIGAPPKPGLTYSWSPAAGLSNVHIANPMVEINGTATFILTVRSVGGGCVDTDTVFVKRTFLDNTITVTGGVTDCNNPAATTLHVSPADSIQWYNESGPIIGATSPDFIVPSSGYYHVYVFSFAGCSSSSRLVYAQVSPIAEALFTINEDVQCFADNEFIFADTSHYNGGGLHYYWDFGDGHTANTRNATHRYNLSGTFTVKFRVWVDNGCSNEKSVTVTVKPGARANFSAEAICVNLPVKLINKTLSPGANAVNYLWEFSNGFSSTAFEPPYSFTLAGTYHIKLTTSTPQCPLPSIKEMDLLIDSPKVPQRSEQTAMINFPQKLSVRSFAARAMWTPAINLDDAYSLKPVFRGFGSQLYSVRLTSATHCITVDTVFVKVIKQISIFVPSAFTPNGDGINDYLKPLLYGFKKVNGFRIYNRWGKLIFQSQDDLKGWDGKISEIPQDTQTVIWMISAVDVDGVTHVEKGTTTIVR